MATATLTKEQIVKDYLVSAKNSFEDSDRGPALKYLAVPKIKDKEKNFIAYRWDDESIEIFNEMAEALSDMGSVEVAGLVYSARKITNSEEFVIFSKPAKLCRLSQLRAN